MGDSYWAVRQLIGRDFSENIPGVASFALAVGSSADWLGHEASSKSKHTKGLPITCRTTHYIYAHQLPPPSQRTSCAYDSSSPGDEPERRHGDVVRLLAELEAVGEAHDVEAGVHRRDVDAQLLRQTQVRPAQLVHVDLIKGRW